MEEYNHVTMLYFMKTIERTVITLIGDDNKIISDHVLTLKVIKSKNPFELAAM